MRGKEIYIKWLLCVLFLFGTVRTTAAGRVVYVDDDAVGTNDGSSWANAFNYLQDAITTASDGDEIRVAQGIYKPDQGAAIVPGDRTATFQPINGVALMGGYAGISTLDSEVRDVEIYETILSGDLNDNDANFQDAQELANAPSRADNSLHVVTIEHVDSCILDGFIIRDGHAFDGGGGLLIHDSNATVRNCSFVHNWGLDDGAVFIPRDNPEIRSYPKILNCKFLKNASERKGGALSIDISDLLLTNCEFVANRSVDGGAISSGFADISLSDCMFRENSAVNDGGSLHIVNSNINLTGCIFMDNSALPTNLTTHSNNWGGAILLSIMSGNQAIATDCLFRNNSAVLGGAIQGNVTALKGCRFTGNVAYDRGGAIDGHGTICENCLFDGNKALIQIAVARCNGRLIFTNCTFVNNRSPDGNSFLAYGGHGSLTENVFKNCIVLGSDHGLDPARSWLQKTLITYCNIQGGWPGEGNIDIGPYFAEPGYWDPNGMSDDPNDDFWVDGDYHLKSQTGRWDPNSQSWIIDDVTSPCIDAGDPNSPVAFEPFPNGGIINMGAYGGTAEASLSPSGIHAKYGGGGGTADDPYLIYTAEQMNTIGAEPNDWGKHIKLMADIDLKDFGDSSFNLVGSDSYPFKGVFDGNGHSISNLTYAVTGNEELTDDSIIANFGLFRSINDPNAMIRDLRLVNPDVGPASACLKRIWHVGALVGTLGSGTVSNCQVEGGQVKGESRTGGLVGFSRGTISDCYTTCRVRQAEQRSLTEANETFDRREFFGGLVGVNIGEISNCHTAGEISGERKIGGLVGEDDGRISNSWSDSNVSGDLDVGGLVGKNRSTSVTSDCYATGYVSGTKSVGGLIGYCTGSIIDCHATGNVSAEQWGGGLAGLNEGAITSCYSTTSVSVNSDTAGGLVGLNGGTILTSLARGDVAGEQSIGGLVGENKKWYQVVAGIPIEFDGVVLDSYARGSVHGKYGVGGLVGTNTGTILKCYSIGELTGEMNFGGLVGINGEIPVLGSFWDTETSGLDTSSGGTGETTTEMQMSSTFLDAGWDFVDETDNNTEDIWWILEGQDYPRLWWETAKGGE